MTAEREVSAATGESARAEKELLRGEYVGRINRVMDHIDGNLASRLPLDELAKVARFSPFHFHRLFSAFVGETLFSYIKRRRVETAASKLLENPRLSVTEITYECGFSGPAAFSRAFRERFDMSPSEFRRGGYRQWSRKGRKAKSKDRKDESKEWIAGLASPHYIDDTILNERGRLQMNVEVKEMPEMDVAYCRHTGYYSGIGNAFDRLFRWAGPRGLLRFPETKVLALYHDDPDITEESKLRSSACITVPAGTGVEGEIGAMKISGGKYAVGRFEIREDQFEEAWNSMMRDWLPGSGYQCADRLPYELYHNDHIEHPEKKFIVDICIPVVPL